MHKLRYCLEVDCLESHENANDATVNWLSLASSQIVLMSRKANSLFSLRSSLRSNQKKVAQDVEYSI